MTIVTRRTSLKQDKQHRFGDLVFARVEKDKTEARIGVLVKTNNEFAWLYGKCGSYRCIMQGMITVPPILWTKKDKQLIVEIANELNIKTMYTVAAQWLLQIDIDMV